LNRAFAITANIGIAVLLLISAACAGEKKAAAPAPRDIILITIDTLRSDALGFAGNTRVKTPFLDSLAARGTIFSEAHAHNVVTLPSHTNILTGLYPWQHGIRDNAGFILDPKTETLGSILHDAGFATAAFVSAYPLDHRFGLARGFDVYDDHYPAALHPLDFAVQERPGGETFALASSWWRANALRRRFLWVHLYEPHAPYDPPPPFREQYRDNPYLGEVAATDSILAQFLGPMLHDNPATLVVITGDHGESLGEHGELTHGLFAYEATLHVPLIVVDPTRPHAVDNRFVGHIDIAPTIVDRAGGKKPPAWKGHSLFEGGDRGHTYFESLSASLNRGWAPLVGIISGGEKLIELPLPELYDLPHDRKETANRYDQDRRTAFALRKILLDEAPSRPAGNRSVSAEEQAKLAALGYVSGTSTKTKFTVADDPKNLVGLDNDLHAAIAFYQKGDLRDALELARKIVKARPDMQIAEEMLAFLLGQNERPDEAIDVLKRNIAAGRGNDAMKVRLGLMLSEQGQARQAVEILQPLSTRDDADLLNAYGIALADNGDPRAAVEQFHHILRFDPRNARAFQNLGIVALRSGDPTRARQYLEEALAIDPKLPLALNTLGVVSAQGGDFNAAIGQWSRAVALDPNLLDALYNLGIVAARVQRPDIARKALQDYLDRAPSSHADERAHAAELLRTLH
jgi:arylsulfatase A-like enzyme/Tfp pilus assembly protein PilF